MSQIKIMSEQMNSFYNKLNSIRTTYGLTEVSPTTQHTQYSKVFASQLNDLVAFSSFEQAVNFIKIDDDSICKYLSIEEYEDLFKQSFKS